MDLLLVKPLSRMLHRFTVGQWIANMGLPAAEIKGERRCRSEDLRRWLTAHKITVPAELLAAAHREPAPLPTFCSALERGGIYHHLAGRDKRAALAEAVERLPLPDTLSAELLLRRLLEREEMASTGVGDGIAIPHPRDPLPQLTAPLAALCFLDRPLEFAAVDGLPVYALFVMASPTPKIHLHVLARLFFLLRKPEVRGLIAPATPPALIFGEARRMEKPLK